MIVNYDKKANEFNTIFDRLINKNQSISGTDEFIECVNTIRELEKSGKFDLKRATFDRLSDSIGNVDQRIVAAAQSVQSGKMAWKEYDDIVAKVFTSTSKFSGVLNAGKGIVKGFGASVLNSFIGFAAGAVISAFISGIDEAIHKTERLIEAGEKAKSSIDSTFNEFSSRKSSIEGLGKSLAGDTEEIESTEDAINSIAEKYAKLREGVNLSDNSSRALSTDEYQSYLDISNQIAEQFPSLISGYDAQGNAILNLGSNAANAAESLTNLYNASMHSSNIEMGENLQDAYTGTKAQAKEYNAQIKNWEGNKKFAEELSEKLSDQISDDNFEISLNEFGAYYKDAIKKAQEILGEEGIVSDQNGTAQTFNLAGVSDATRKELQDSISELYTIDIVKYKQNISGTKLLIEEQWDSLANSVGQYLQTSPSFTNLNSTLQNAILQNITDLDLSKIGSDYGGDIDQYIYSELLSPLSDMSPQTQEAVADLFRLNTDSLNYAEYQKTISNQLEKAFPDDTETQNQMRELFGFDQVEKDAEVQLNRLRDQFGDAVNDFTLSELESGFDLVTNDKFSGTFAEFQDEIEKTKALAATGIDLEAHTNMDAIETALQTENAGSDYEKAVSYLQQAKDLYDKGLVGTDDFKSIASYISADSMDDPVNFAKNYEKAARYLTDDGAGIQNFLHDLQSNGFAQVENLSDGTQKWTYSIEDLEAASQKMGIGFEFMMDMFGRLEDYGFHNNFVGSVEDGAQKITDLTSQLAQEEKKLAQLEAEGADTTAIDQQREKVNALKADIEATRSAMEQLTQNSADDYANQVRTAKETIASMAAERDKIMKENPYGEDTQLVADLMEQEIRAIADEYGIELDANLNILEPEETLTVTVNAELNKQELDNHLNEMNQGQSLLFQGEVNGQSTFIEAEKTAYGSIIYTADIDGAERTLSLIENEDGTISFTAEVNAVEEETSKTYGGTRSTTFAPDTQALNSVTAVTYGGMRAVDYIANTLGLPSYFPPIVRAVSYVISGASAAIYAARLAAGDTFLNGTAYNDGSSGGLLPHPLLSGRALAMGTLRDNTWLKPGWKTKRGQVALTGEIGPEMVVKGNRWWTVGDRGAEFAKIPQGAVVFNADQTRKLLTDGRINSRGKAFSSGTAYGGGSGGSSHAYFGGAAAFSSGSVKSSSSSRASSNSSSSSKNAADDFEKTIDWIATAIDRLERAIDMLDLKASSTYRSWSERNKNLSSEISKITQEINLQQQGYNRYLQQANAVGLSSAWAAKVQNGQVDISTITDENLAEKISEYQDW